MTERDYKDEEEERLIGIIRNPGTLVTSAGVDMNAGDIAERLIDLSPRIQSMNNPTEFICTLLENEFNTTVGLDVLMAYLDGDYPALAEFIHDGVYNNNSILHEFHPNGSKLRMRLGQ